MRSLISAVFVAALLAVRLALITDQQLHRIRYSNFVPFRVLLKSTRA